MFRPFVAALTLASIAAFAQSTEEPAPPLVPADQPPPTPPPEPPSQQQYQQQQRLKRQQQPVQPQPIQPYQQQPQQYQQQQPQPYQPQYQYQQQPPQYQQQPYPPGYQQQPYPPQYQQQPQPYPQQPPPPQYVPQARRPRPPPPKDPADGFHVKVLLDGSVGLLTDAIGFTGGVRAEFDINRFAIFGAYNRFITSDLNSEVNQFSIMGGYSLMANRIGRFRVLGGLDLISSPSVVALGPVVGLNTRLGLGFLGFDGAAFLTFYPYRQLEFRAAAVFRFWVLELHAGWRYQVMDAVQPADGGSFGTTFLAAPVVNGPYLAVGLAF